MYECALIQDIRFPLLRTSVSLGYVSKHSRPAVILTVLFIQPHDAIDLTDNDIQFLGNFPLSARLRTLLLARNRITSIQPGLAKALPNLTTLVLTANNFAELADLDHLSHLTKLTHLVLSENPVARKEVRLHGVLPFILEEWLQMHQDRS